MAARTARPLDEVVAAAERVFARRGYRVNALDDDPNPNLAAALGLTADQLSQLRRVPREDVVEERTDPAGHTDLVLTRPFEEILGHYGVVAPDGVGVLSMTGLLGAGRG